MRRLKDIYESILDDKFASDKNVDHQLQREIVLKWIQDNYTLAPHKLKIFKRPNKDGKLIVDYDANIYPLTLKLDAKSITNDFFIWRNVKGEFNCSGNGNIQNMNGAPSNVHNIHIAGCTNLTTLEGGFNTCNHFKIRHCPKITNLKGVPNSYSSLTCEHCENLTSIEGCPEKTHEFVIRSCGVTSLKGGPKKCDIFAIKDCPIQSLEYAPDATRTFNCTGCNIISLKGAPKKVEFFDCSGNPNLRSLKYAPEAGSRFACHDCGVRFEKEEILKISPKLEDLLQNTFYGIQN